jgi:uncharacterized protein (TIGR02145 family)
MNNKSLFSMFVMLLCLLQANAQVTIGALDHPAKGAILDLNPKSISQHGGLLLPNVFITNSDSLPAALAGSFSDAERDYSPNLAGLVVYNSNPDLAGGLGIFVWDGSDWKKTGADSGFKTECELTPITATGGDLTCSVVDEFCALDADYTFNLLAGSDFVTLTAVDARKGKFMLTFDHNPTSEARTVIVLVTSPCGDAHAFVYQQDGDSSGCGATPIAPQIVAENTTDLCLDGAVYLYLQGRPATGTYIWARNGVQIASGVDFTATQPGVYIVYADKIGCTDVKPDTVHVAASSTTAPAAAIAVAENSGALCASGTTVNLYAVIQGSGTAVWYRNGLRQPGLTGSPIAAGEGEWFAVIEDGGCSSVPSNTVAVYHDNAGSGSIVAPTIEINDVPASGSIALCRGGTPTFKVVAPQTGETYTWFRNNTEIGTGASVTYNIGTDENFILRCRASVAGECPKETDIEVTVGSVRPATPSITCNTPGDAICGGTATLTANSSGTVSSYLWFRSDTETGTFTQIAGESAQMLNITQTGYYKVQTQDGACRSAMSNVKSIATTSGAATVTISGKATGVNPGDTETYTATMNNPQGASYSWTVEPGTTGATPASGTSDNIALTFASVGTATLTIAASNACGTATVSNNSYTVTVVPACTSVSINSCTPSTKTASALEGEGTAIILSISASGSPTLSYQWYSNSTASNTGGAAIGSATANSYSTPTALTAGTYYYYCIATSSCDGSTATSDVFTVTINTVETLPKGSGTFTGRVCFDIASSNDGGTCSLLSRRQAQTLTANENGRADFTNTITNTQTYTFKPYGTVSNVRFMAIEAPAYTGQIIASITGGDASDNISAAVPCTVVYKDDLNTKAYGLTTDNAITVDIYAIYTSNGKDCTKKLTAKIKDCICCGAYISATDWREFMCHNLGADTSADPFIPAAGLNGDYYQWGGNLPVKTFANDGDDTAENGYSWDTTPSGYWGENKYNPSTTTKSAYDPCPSGYRVPNYDEWDYVIKNNTLTYVPTTWNLTVSSTLWQGLKFGALLYLPAAGVRSYSMGGGLYVRGTVLYYWTTCLSTSQPSNFAAHFKSDYTGGASVVISANRRHGYSVRCISE